MTERIATRAEGERQLAAFVPCMGRRYANGRNTDHGPGAHQAVSMLSPYIRRRLVLESEVVAAALAAHGPAESEKFVQEVIWRSYFKGWLEHRPQIWTRYRQGLTADLAALGRDRRLRRDVDRAMQGQTGLACFDAWGVAGLHTRGKPYPAEAQNIATFTAGRFTPRPGELAEVTEGLEATEPEGLPPVLPLRDLPRLVPGVPTALLITEEDCRLEDFDLSAVPICTTATLAASDLRSELGVSDLVHRFEAAALDDAATRLGVMPDRLRADDPAALARWAAAAGAAQIVTPFVPQGPLRDWLDEAAPALAQRNIVFSEIRRDWDSVIWPHATAGFFKVRQQIPTLMAQLLPM